MFELWSASRSNHMTSKKSKIKTGLNPDQEGNYGFGELERELGIGWKRHHRILHSRRVSRGLGNFRGLNFGNFRERGWKNLRRPDGLSFSQTSLKYFCSLFFRVFEIFFVEKFCLWVSRISEEQGQAMWRRVCVWPIRLCVGGRKGVGVGSTDQGQIFSINILPRLENIFMADFWENGN